MTSRVRGVLPATGIALLLAFGVALARVGASHPLLLLATPAVLGLVVLGAAVARWPLAALHASVFTLLVASTKFRSRDATDSLAGSVDAQVIAELLLFAAAGFVVIVLFTFRRQLIARRRLALAELLLVCFVLLALASAAWSTSPMFTFIRAGELAILLSLVLLAARMTTAAGLMRILAASAVVYAVVFPLAAKLFTFAKGTQVDFYGIHRFSWFAVHPIEAATYAALAALFVLAAVLFDEQPLRVRRFGVPLLLLVPYLLAILLATRSRGPLFAFLPAAALLVLFRRGTVLNASVLLTVVLLGGALAASSGITMAGILRREQVSTSPVARLFLRGQTVDEFTSLTDRDEVWSASYQLIRERPLVGGGFQDSRSYLLPIIPWAAYAHNAFIQTLVDLGLLGALLLYGAYLTAFLPGWPRARDVTLEDRGARSLVIAVGVFLAVNGISAESFAAAPTYQTLILLGIIVVASQARAERARVGAGWRAWSPVLTVPHAAALGAESAS